MRRHLFSAAAGAVVAFAVAGGIALAAMPGSGGVINGCYQKNEGQLRVIDPGVDTCRKPEVAIAWNEQGVKGDKGDKGDAGVKGEKGDTGAPGRDGSNGTSVTVEPEASGANCAAGGVKITAANGVAYVCNALPPDPGAD
jgi:hypothetical protein